MPNVNVLIWNYLALFLYHPFTFGDIPIALLSGLTLYMGVVATFGVQFFKRLELLFMAPSQHPYIEYLDNVSIPYYLWRYSIDHL